MQPCVFVKEGSASLCGTPVSGLLQLKPQAACDLLHQDTEFLTPGASCNATKGVFLLLKHRAEVSSVRSWTALRT